MHIHENTKDNSRMLAYLLRIRKENAIFYYFLYINSSSYKFYFILYFILYITKDDTIGKLYGKYIYKKPTQSYELQFFILRYNRKKTFAYNFFFSLSTWI